MSDSPVTSQWLGASYEELEAIDAVLPRERIEKFSGTALEDRAEAIKRMVERIKDLEFECGARAKSQMGYNMEVLELRAQLEKSRHMHSEAVERFMVAESERKVLQQQLEQLADNHFDVVDQRDALQLKVEFLEAENNSLGEENARLAVELERFKRRTQPVVIPAYDDYSVEVEVS